LAGRPRYESINPVDLIFMGNAKGEVGTIDGARNIGFEAFDCLGIAVICCSGHESFPYKA
jgi:hypothetical protein